MILLNLYKKNDIVCLSESKLADTDTVCIDGFTSFYKNRDIFKRKLGGTLLLVRNCLLKYLTVYEENRFKQKKMINRYYSIINLLILNFVEMASGLP